MDTYKNILRNNLEQVLNLYDLDPTSPKKGVGDRLHWGWKVSDFTNATLQGGVHSLAIALKLGIAPNDDFVLRVIDQVIRAVPQVGTKKGSMQEAFPNEHSFCVTALVAFDVLSAIKHLGDQISDQQKKEYLDIVRPLIAFITKNGEEHAIISNHLATGVAAVTLWNKLTGENNGRWQELLDIIYEHQSDEGWHREYDGADPGYQTLCLYYLASAWQDTKDEKLFESMRKAAAFLAYFVHPDGSIGGLYGARNTEVYYPGGIVAMATEMPEMATLASALWVGYEGQCHLLPQNIDIGNYIPLLNAYAFAADHTNEVQGNPIPHATVFEKQFPQAGIFIKSTADYYAIVNFKKGGTLKVYDKATRTLDIEDGGLLATLRNGKQATTQAFDQSQTFANHQINADFYMANHAWPTPFKFIILRSLNITLLKSVSIGNAFKKRVVKMLMTGKKKAGGNVVRTFEFGENQIIVNETITAPPNALNVAHPGKFKAIHMASSGYFMAQHIAGASPSQKVTFK